MRSSWRTRRSAPTGEAFEAGAHLGHLAQFGHVEFGDAKAAPRFALCQSLCLQLAEGLAHWDMARAELGSDMVLPEARAGRNLARDDTVSKDAGDAGGLGLFRGVFHEL